MVSVDEPRLFVPADVEESLRKGFPDETTDVEFASLSVCVPADVLESRTALNLETSFLELQSRCVA